MSFCNLLSSSFFQARWAAAATEGHRKRLYPESFALSPPTRMSSLNVGGDPVNGSVVVSLADGGEDEGEEEEEALRESVVSECAGENCIFSLFPSPLFFFFGPAAKPSGHRTQRVVLLVLVVEMKFVISGHPPRENNF